MIEIALYKRTPNEIIDIVRSMRDTGMIQGIDFDFKFNQTKREPYGGYVVSAEHTVFVFYEEKYATWFLMRWS